MAGCVAKSALASFVSVKATFWDASSGGPGEIVVAHWTLCGPASSTVDRLLPGVKVGASFTLATVIENAAAEESVPPVAVPPSSWALTVMLALPLAFGAGV